MNVLALPERTDDRRSLFLATAHKLRLGERLVEKDFWACWTLGRLFEVHEDEAVPSITFKGGTSLSKVHKLINRFSEDLDVSLDRAHDSLCGGPEGPEDPVQLLTDGSPSRNKLKNTSKLLREYASQLVENAVILSLHADFAGQLNSAEGDGWWLKPTPRTDNSVTSLEFYYPAVCTEGRTERILIEYGVSDREPSGPATIQPYAAEAFPDQFTQPSCTVRALHAGRTFWEKVTALHEFSQKPHLDAAGKARHYYDVAQMESRADEWVGDSDTFDAVLRMKKALFAAPVWDDVSASSLKLIPDEGALRRLEADYRDTSDMLFSGPSGEQPPTWSDVVKAVYSIEKRLQSG